MVFRLTLWISSLSHVWGLEPITYLLVLLITARERSEARNLAVECTQRNKLGVPRTSPPLNNLSLGFRAFPSFLLPFFDQICSVYEGKVQSATFIDVMLWRSAMVYLRFEKLNSWHCIWIIFLVCLVLTHFQVQFELYNPLSSISPRDWCMAGAETG